jgi:hypothetical protein
MNEPYRIHGRLDPQVVILAFALDRWEARDDTKPQPAVRRAANTAMDAIDGMILELYALRSRLAGEIRSSDDTAAARVDALLARPGTAMTQRDVS